MSGKGNSRKNKKTWKTTARGESKAPPSAPSVDKATLPSLTAITAKSFQELLSDEFGDEEPERLTWAKLGTSDEEEKDAAPGTKCIIKVGNILFSVHKTVLGAGLRSSKFFATKFARCFSVHWPEASNFVTVVDAPLQSGVVG